MDLLLFDDEELMKTRDLVLVDVLDITLADLESSEAAVFCLDLRNCNTIDVPDDSNCAASAMLYHGLAMIV